mmetsp:Transcript_14254/g.20269  ORF Transcript_14254/g.20269 Transcript_14254/m.20269 type:complete len:256 (+) Transcript_14254:488-1255(+)
MTSLVATSALEAEAIGCRENVWVASVPGGAKGTQSDSTPRSFAVLEADSGTISLASVVSTPRSVGAVSSSCFVSFSDFLPSQPPNPVKTDAAAAVARLADSVVILAAAAILEVEVSKAFEAVDGSFGVVSEMTSGDWGSACTKGAADAVEGLLTSVSHCPTSDEADTLETFVPFVVGSAGARGSVDAEMGESVSFSSPSARASEVVEGTHSFSGWDSVAAAGVPFHQLKAPANNEELSCMILPTAAGADASVGSG